jgi:hypothetical protein
VNTVSNKVKFIRSVFGICDIDRSGENAAVPCPSCKTSTKKKLSINLSTWQTHCWVCGLKGKTLLPILKKYFRHGEAAVFKTQFMPKHAYVHLSEQEEEEKLALPAGYTFLGKIKNVLDPDIKACIHYLLKRGLTEKDIWYFKLGTIASGRYCRRVIIPSFDDKGQLNFFVARSIDSDNNFKYINAPTDKKTIIFNEHNIDWSNELTLVEGPFDLMKCNENATCLLGSSLTEEMKLFQKVITNRTPVVLALDSDMGYKTQKIASILASYDCQVRMIELGDKSDVGEMSKAEFQNALLNAPLWQRDLRLKYKISEIGSGSIL